MRLVNDKQDQSEPAEFPLLLIAGFGLFAAFGIASVILAPVPMILAHLRLSEPWPKLAAVTGAILAVALLTAPPVLVLVGFTIGLFVADSVAQGRTFPRIAATTLALAGSVMLVTALVLAQIKGQTLAEFWVTRVQRVVEILSVGFQLPADSVPAFRTLFLQEGPALLLGSFLLSLWLSIGLCAHAGWFPPEHPCSGTSLRKLRLPGWVALVFVASFLGAQLAPGLGGALCAATTRFLSFVFFVQGCAFLSSIFEFRSVRPRVRTILYLLMVPAFLPVAAIGVVGSWFLVKRLEEKK